MGVAVVAEGRAAARALDAAPVLPRAPALALRAVPGVGHPRQVEEQEHRAGEPEPEERAAPLGRAPLLEGR